MAKMIAWDVMNKVVLPRTQKLGVETHSTIYSRLDWDNGVALQTAKGDIHVLGTGEIVDENDVLGYRAFEENKIFE